MSQYEDLLEFELSEEELHIIAGGLLRSHPLGLPTHPDGRFAVAGCFPNRTCGVGYSCFEGYCYGNSNPITSTISPELQAKIIKVTGVRPAQLPQVSVSLLPSLEELAASGRLS